MLGEHEPPKKKEKKKKKQIAEPEEIEDIEEIEDKEEDPVLYSLSQAITPSKPRLKNRTNGNPVQGAPSRSGDSQCPRIKKNTHCSDEEEFSD
ncbi:hypothetical protein H920_14551 [Fukomys damarensis]|uniref:Uncharacterized protein n=1 Tax=Fukomys damarensis TaxID=885580 RepID=A0A091DMS1_FUKDA|nr:hypothetical protein H920_14551 [Fukomys damarensis]